MDAAHGAVSTGEAVGVDAAEAGADAAEARADAAKAQAVALATAARPLTL